MLLGPKWAWILPGLFVVLVSSVPSKALAIPYFARKYKTTCSRCHYAVPKLNTFGKNFQLHGYQQPGDEPVNKIDFPEDKNLTLIDELPVAFLVENQLQLDKVAGNQTADNIASPLVFHLFAADTIAPDIGVFGELADQNGSTDIGKLSIIFSHLGNRNIFGQVGNLDPAEHGVTEHDLFGRSGYAIQDVGLNNTGSPWLLNSQHMGVRIYGLLGAAVTPDLIHSKPTGGDTTPAAKPDPGAPMRLANYQKAPKAAKSEDDIQEEADPMDRLTGFLWEFGVYNSVNSAGATIAPNPSDFQARVNMYFGGDSFIGLAGYSGLMTAPTGNLNHYEEAGPDFSIYYGKPFEKSKGMMIKPFNLLGGYLVGQADNPGGDDVRASYNGYFLEQDYAPNPRSVCFLRYDKINSSNLGYLTPAAFSEGLTANYTYYLRTNFWVGLEYTQDLSSAKQNLFGVLFDFAF